MSKETPKKGWSNPALRMMGIPRIALPSRNWMIFLSIVGAIGGGIGYDKYQQRQIRQKYVEKVEKLGLEQYASDRVPRKLSIFIAPPPDDFLESSLVYFRRWIKPILNSAAIDYDIYTENRQGEIRSQVAEKIRQLRRQKRDEKSASEEAKKEKKTVKSGVDEEELVARHELYKPQDVLGLYRIFTPFQPKRDDEENDELAGGVICVGRGAYKEYISGVHEGLLGPLDAPEPTPEPEAPTLVEPEDGTVKTLDEKTIETDPKTTPEPEKKEEDEEPEIPIPKPYILPAQYPEAALAPELDMLHTIKNEKNVPVLFEQAVYVFPVHNLLGFLNFPKKIYRYFNRRTVAEDFGHRTMAIVDNTTRAFEFRDQLQAKEEELDWPKKWVEKGKTKGSEWVQELEVDERITRRMRVFEVRGKDEERDEK